MPINPINSGGGKPKETALDKILKGLQLAESSLGIAVNYNKIGESAASRRKSTLEADTLERQNKNVYTPLEIGKAGFIPSPLTSQPAGSPLTSGPGGSPLAKPRFSKLPSMKFNVQTAPGQSSEQEFVQGDVLEKAKDRETGLAKEWVQHPVTKGTLDMYGAKEKVKQLIRNPGKYGPDQVAMLQTFMRAVAEGRVTDADYRAATDAGGVFNKMANYLTSAKTGKPIEAKVIPDYENAVENLFAAQIRLQSKVDSQFQKRVEDEGFQLDRIVIPLQEAIKSYAGPSIGSQSEKPENVPQAAWDSATPAQRADFMKKLNGG